MKRYLSFPVKLYLVALLLRLIPVLLTYDLPIGLDDMFQYDMLARNLATGNGFRWYGENEIALFQRYVSFEFLLPDNYDPAGVLTSFRAPAYPAFLAIIYLFTIESQRWFMARIAQAFLGATLAPLTYHLAKYIFPDAAKSHKFAGGMLAAYPMLLIYPIGLATENLFLPLLLGSTLTLLIAAERRSVWFFILAGVLFGVTALTRSIIVASIPILFLWLWFGMKQKKSALLFLITSSLVIVPWSIRNTRLHNKFTLIETSMGYNLHMGYHPDSTGTFTYGVSLELLPYIDDMAREEAGKSLALQYVKENPSRIPELVIRKLGHFFALETRPLAYFYSNNFFGFIPQPLLIGIFVIFGLPFALLMIGGTIGAVLAKKNKATLLLAAISITYLIPHILIMAEPRFHLALVPFIAIFAAYGWHNRNQFSTLPKWKTITAYIIISLLLINWGGVLWQNADQLMQLFGPDGNQSYFSY